MRRLPLAGFTLVIRQRASEFAERAHAPPPGPQEGDANDLRRPRVAGRVAARGAPELVVRAVVHVRRLHRHTVLTAVVLTDPATHADLLFFLFRPRRSRADRPPQTPSVSSFSSAHSRHSARTGQARQVRFAAAASSVPCPTRGKCASGSVCAQRASSSQLRSVTWPTVRVR